MFTVRNRNSHSFHLVPLLVMFTYLSTQSKMDFSDISRLYLVNSCLSKVAKSAPEGRAVCLQLPVKQNMMLVITKRPRNMCKILSVHNHPFSIHSHWDYVMSLLLALFKVTEEFHSMPQQRTVCPAYRTPDSKQNIRGSRAEKNFINVQNYKQPT